MNETVDKGDIWQICQQVLLGLWRLREKYTNNIQWGGQETGRDLGSIEILGLNWNSRDHLWLEYYNSLCSVTVLEYLSQTNLTKKNLYLFWPMILAQYEGQHIVMAFFASWVPRWYRLSHKKQWMQMYVWTYSLVMHTVMTLSNITLVIKSCTIIRWTYVILKPYDNDYLLTYKSLGVHWNHVQTTEALEFWPTQVKTSN